MHTVKTQFDLHTKLFNNVLSEISDEQADIRADEKINHIKWLAGHITAARMGLGKFGGLDEDKSFDEFFGHGKSIDTTLNYPSLKEIQNKWNAISERISEGLANLPSDILRSKAPIQVPVSDPSMEGFLGFMMHHEAYHIGQMGILRKFTGKEAMSYK